MSRCSLLAVGRPTFDLAAAQAVVDRARAVLERLGAELTGPAAIVTEPAGAAAAARAFRAAGPGLNVLLSATFADARLALAGFAASPGPVVLWAVREPGPVGDRLWLNSLCGANLAAHALVREGRAVHLVYGDPEEEAVQARLRDALAGALPSREAGQPAAGPLAPAARPQSPAEETLAALRGRRIGVIGDIPPGFTTCEYDTTWLRDTLGLRVQALDLEEVFRRVRGLPEQAGRAASARMLDGAAARFPAEQLEAFGRVARALGDWRAEEHLDGLALRCWPELPQDLGVCPCWALGRMAGEGVATACEVDVNGSATMLLMRALGADDAFLGDTVRLDEPGDTVTFWHCGSASPALADGEVEVGLHCNRRVGVAGNFALREGPVTVARISRSRDGYRLLVAGGTALSGPNRFQGNSVDVALDGSAQVFVHTLVEGGFEHHVVLGWADLRPQLRWVAGELGLRLVEP